MTWNYRVVDLVDPVNNEPYRAIYEVHYDNQGVPAAHTENPAVVMVNIGESVGAVIKQMEACLDMPILVEEDFVGNMADV